MADDSDFDLWTRAEQATMELLRLLRDQRNQPNFHDYWFRVGLQVGRVERTTRDLATAEAAKR